MDRQTRTDGGRHGLLDELCLGRAGLARRLLHRPPFDLGDGGGYADQDTRPVESRQAGALQQQADHSLRDVEVGDRTLPERANGHDVAGCAPDHLPSLVSHGEDVVGLAVERDDSGLVEHDPAALRVHERVGRAQIDGEVSRQSTLLEPVHYGRRPPGCAARDLRCRASGASASSSRANSRMWASIVRGLRCRSQSTRQPMRVMPRAIASGTS